MRSTFIKMVGDQLIIVEPTSNDHQPPAPPLFRLSRSGTFRVHIWDPESVTELRMLEQPVKGVILDAVSWDGNLVLAGRGFICVWRDDCVDCIQIDRIVICLGVVGPKMLAGLGPDLSESDLIKPHALLPGDQIAVWPFQERGLTGHRTPVESNMASSETTFLAIGSDIKLWDALQMICIRTIDSNTRWCKRPVLRCGDNFLYGSYSKSIGYLDTVSWMAQPLLKTCVTSNGGQSNQWMKHGMVLCGHELIVASNVVAAGPEVSQFDNDLDDYSEWPWSHVVFSVYKALDKSAPPADR